MARLDETGELQPAREEFFHPGFEALRAEATAEAAAKATAEAAEAAAKAAAEATAEVAAEAIAQQRELLQHQTERKFGAETAERLGALLATIDDPSRLRTVAGWIIDCAQARDLLARLQGPA